MNPVLPIIAVRAAQFTLLLLAGHVLLHWPLHGLHAPGLWLTPALCAYFVFVFVGHWTWGLPITTRLPANTGGVALTFDDGPTDTTACILDILQTHNACATFFVLGERAQARPDLVRRILNEGHTLGLHGFAHVPYVLQSLAGVRRDIANARAALPDTPIIWVRPPHGFKTPALPFLLRRLGYTMAAWSLNGRDYQLTDPAQIAARVLQRAHSGDIILLHDGPRNAATADALPLILQGLEQRGLPCISL